MESIELLSNTAVKSMIDGGHRLASVMNKVLAAAKPGLSLNDLEKLAQRELKKQGGKPSFQRVAGYRHVSCLNLNEGVVHGVPNAKKLTVGDLLSVDLGLFYQGYHTDMARTIIIGQTKDKDKHRLIETGRLVLDQAVAICQPGNFVGQLSKTIEDGLRSHRFYPVKELTGHGVGRKLHQEPSIPCFLKGSFENTVKLKTGMALAIEVIYTAKPSRLRIATDGWTVEAGKGVLAGLFEDTVLVTDSGCRVLTQ